MSIVNYVENQGNTKKHNWQIFEHNRLKPILIQMIIIMYHTLLSYILLHLWQQHEATQRQKFEMNLQCIIEVAIASWLVMLFYYHTPLLS